MLSLEYMWNRITKVWASSSPLRHAVGAFLAVELAPYLTQVYEWTIGKASLPDWSLAAHNLAKAIVGAIVLAFLRWLQKRYTTQTTNQ